MKQRRISKYILSIENARKLEEVARIRIPGWCAVVCVVAVILVAMGIGALIMGLTPLKRNLPGYLSTAHRQEYLQAVQHIDSLKDALALNQRYLDNISTIFDTDRTPADSTSVSQTSLEAPLPLDSLITGSAREREFVAQMDERERFNLSVLSPLAADGLIFSYPADGGIITEDSRKSFTLKVILPSHTGINALSDGKVVDVHSSSDGTFTIMVQHPKGFLSKYSKTGTPLVEPGLNVLAGQRLTEGDARHRQYVEIEMWRNGTRLRPAEYLQRFQESTDDINATPDNSETPGTKAKTHRRK